MNILFTGGTGRLSVEVKKILEAEYVGIEHWDFIYPEEIPKKKYDLIIHAGAYTDVVKAETEQQKCMLANVMGTFNMVQVYKDTPFIYISTEYARNPLGVYALSKQLGEEAVKTHPHHLILRTLFKPNPFPYEFAYEDQWTQGDSVDVIAKELKEWTRIWDKTACLSTYMGTGRKTLLELARKTNPNVKPNKIADYKYSHLVPHDYEN